MKSWAGNSNDELATVNGDLRGNQVVLPTYEVNSAEWRVIGSSTAGVSKVVDIDPWGSMGLSKGSINAWGSKGGQ